MSAELKKTIRSILIEELAAHGIDKRKLAPNNVREEFISIKSDNDLSRFVRRILDLTNNKQTRADIESGRLQFRLTNGGQSGTAQPRVVASAPKTTAVNIEHGLITEKQINHLPEGVSLIKLGKAARLTPLAQDAIRQAGISIERVKT